MHVSIYPYAYLRISLRMLACIPMHFAYVLTHVCIYPYACLHASLCMFVYIRMHAYIHALLDSSSRVKKTAPKTKKKVREQRDDAHEEEHEEEGKLICIC